MRTAFIIAAVVGAGLSLTACADKLPGKPLTAADFEIATARAKLMIEEGKKFDASHPLKGQVADMALRQLHDEEYACHIGYLDLVRIAEDGVTMRLVKTPLVFCMQRSSKPNDICAERRVTLAIDWRDPKVAELELRLQLASSQIDHLTFRCVPASEVGR